MTNNLMQLSIRNRAIAVQIYGYCNPIGWNATVPEVADAIDRPVNAVRAVVGFLKWGTRFRSSQVEPHQMIAALPGQRSDLIDLKDYRSRVELE